MGGEARKPNPVLKVFRLFPTLVDKFFYWYGGFLADHARWFIAIPVLVSFVLTPGIVQLNREVDDTKIWPMKGDLSINSPKSRQDFNQLPSICNCYECDDTGGNCELQTDCEGKVPKLCKGSDEGLDLACPHVMLMFTSRNNLSMIDPKVVEALFEVDMKVTYEKHIVNRMKPRFFSSNESDWELCQRKADGSCVQYSLLTGVRPTLEKIFQLKTDEEQLDFLMDLSKPENAKMKEDMFGLMKDTYYPFDSDKPGAAFTGPVFGDVVLENPNNTWRNGHKASKVKFVGAFRMFYCLNMTDEMYDINMQWGRELRTWLEEEYVYNNSFDLFNLEIESSWTRLDRGGEEIQRLLPSLVICLICLMFFSGLTTLRGHPVHRTLPWIGPIGVGCSVLACGSAFGLVGWMGMEIVDLCFAIPLLILAVGIDDVFVYTENWRFTKPAWRVRKRTAVTMRRAAPGIMVTSFMNSLAFIIDTQSPFYVLQVFSNVSVIAAVFDLTFQMTIFPAALALLGEVDRKSHHACVCCIKIKPRVNASYREQNFWYLICCTAPKSTLLNDEGIPMTEATAGSKTIEKRKMVNEKVTQSAQSRKSQHFFMDIYAPFLLKPKVSMVAMLIYAGYLATCAVLATRIHVGLRMENLAPERPDGALNEVQLYMKYFRDFSYPVDILFEGNISYWRNETQNSIKSLYDDLLEQPHIGTKILGRNWLEEFVIYAKDKHLNISTEEQFVYNLRFKFLSQRKIPQELLADIRFADQSWEDYALYNRLYYNNTYFPRVVYSRLIIYTVEITSLTESGEVVTALRNVKQKYENEEIDFNVYTREFIETEPMMATGYIVVSNTLIQLAAILLVTTLMMPHPVALFWIAVILSSITFGVITITCSWGIDFDQIAMINIMLTMGYCVDFSAHMTRTYVSSKAKTRYLKTREAVGEFGFPIIQSSIAALMSVLGLGASYSYILNAGFKFFFVGILNSVFHTLVVFPVFLLYLGPQPLQQTVNKKKSKKSTKNQNGDKFDALKMVKSIDKDLKLEKQRALDVYQVSAKKGAAVSIAGSVTSVATGPLKRSAVPQLTALPSLHGLVLSEESNSVTSQFSNSRLQPRIEDKNSNMTESSSDSDLNLLPENKIN